MSPASGFGYEINEGFPLIVAPDVIGLPQEGARLGDGSLRTVVSWAKLVTIVMQTSKNANVAALAIPRDSISFGPNPVANRWTDCLAPDWRWELAHPVQDTLGKSRKFCG